MEKTPRYTTVVRGGLAILAESDIPLQNGHQERSDIQAARQWVMRMRLWSAYGGRRPNYTMAIRRGLEIFADESRTPHLKITNPVRRARRWIHHSVKAWQTKPKQLRRFPYRKRSQP